MRAEAIAEATPRRADVPRPGAPGARAVAVMAGLAVAAFALAYLSLGGFLTDDTFISLVYARNLTAGHGLVYNPGEPVEGYTNFLWTVLLAIPVLIPGALVPAVKVLTAGFALASALAIHRLARAVIAGPEEGRSPAVVALPALLFLATPAVVMSAAEGLETMLFTFLLALGLAWFLEEREHGGFPRSALAMAALALARPDGATFGVLLLGFAALERRPRAYLLRFAAAFLVPFGIYFALRAAYYGQPLPNTFYAKNGGDPFLLGRGLWETRRFLAQCGGWAWLAGLLALRPKRMRPAIALFLFAFALRLAFQLWSGGPWMGRFRFLVPVLPLVHVSVVAGIASLVRPAPARWAALALAAALLLAPGWLEFPRERGLALHYQHSLARGHGRLGRDIRERTRPDALIAMDDAGLGPFTSERANLDMLGLNDEHIAHLPGRFGRKIDVDYVLGRRPDLIVLLATVARPTRIADFRLPQHAAIFVSPEFQRDWGFVRDYPFDTDYHLLVFRRRDSQSVPADF